MNQVLNARRVFLAAIASSVFMFPAGAGATVVDIQTNQGNFQVNLYDNGTPQTVANFLSYASNLQYDNSFIHRSVPGFVVQGGGFSYDPVVVTDDIPNLVITASAPVVNEPEFANVRGTIAMARPAGTNFDTATNQWFINLSDNTAGLDVQDFAVFGEVIGDGMDVVDAIAALQTFPFTSPFDTIPLDNYSVDNFNTFLAVDDTHLVIVTAVVVTDATIDSAAGLNPPDNTSITTPPPAPPPAPAPSGGGGGGSLGLFGLLILTLIIRRRKFV